MSKRTVILWSTLIVVLLVRPWGALAQQDDRRVTFSAELLGKNEVAAPGDPDGRGVATITIEGMERLCFSITVEGIRVPGTGALIYEGGAGEIGDVVVPLRAPDDMGKAEGCQVASTPEVVAILRDIRANPEAFYVNVHTSDHPDGALRGQLAEQPKPALPDTGGGTTEWLLITIALLALIVGVGVQKCNDLDPKSWLSRR